MYGLWIGEVRFNMKDYFLFYCLIFFFLTFFLILILLNNALLFGIIPFQPLCFHLKVPSLCEDLLSSIDQPLKIAKDKESKKDYLLCDYNRDGDSYRYDDGFGRLQDGEMSIQMLLRLREGRRG